MDRINKNTIDITVITEAICWGADDVVLVLFEVLLDVDVCGLSIDDDVGDNNLELVGDSVVNDVVQLHPNCFACLHDSELK